MDFDTAASHCPPTAARKQAANVDAFLSKPGIARANIAASTAAPDGSPESVVKYKDYVSFLFCGALTSILATSRFRSDGHE
jgi:hypothetical protein